MIQPAANTVKKTRAVVKSDCCWNNESGMGGLCGSSPLPELDMQLGLLGFKLTDDQSPPGLTGASQGGEHQFQPGPLAEGVRDHFGPSAFLAEQPLHQVGGPNGLAVSDGQVHASKSSSKQATAPGNSRT